MRKDYDMKNDDILRVEIRNTVPEQDHFHQDAELFFVLEGTLTISIGEQSSTLKEADVFIVNLQKSYRAQASPDVLFVKLTLPSQLIGKMAQSSHLLFWCDSSREENSQYQELRRILKQLLDRYLTLHGKTEDFGYMALCYRLLDVLYSHFRSNIVSPDSPGKEERFKERMEQINSYIHANFNQPLSTKELVEKLYLSQGYLTRFFRKNYGVNFAEYLTNVRLYHAVDDLLYTNLPITYIAYNNGFANVAAFTKAFRNRYGDTPSTVRRQQQDKSAPLAQPFVDPAAEKRLEQLLNTDTSYREDEIQSSTESQSCQADQWEPIENIWCDTLNVGAAADLLSSQVQEHLVRLGEDLHLSHVRFWNVFSKEMLLDSQGEYNFSKLDSILDFLLEHNLKPHIELGAKPRRLYRDVGKALVEEFNTTLPMGEKAWVNLFRALVSHCLMRYTRSELSSWRLELWFDESQWGKEGSVQAYFSQFNQVYEIAKGQIGDIEVGGCGLRLGFSDDGPASLDFLRQWKKQPVQPDFLSILYYPYDRGEMNQDSYSRRSTDTEGILHKANAARRLMEEAGMAGVKLYITEWNLTISDRNFINDSCYKGAYLVKNAMDLLGKADLVSYFFASDLVSEYMDSRGLLHGGSGIISKDGILKPAGFAFLFLSWLYSNAVAKGKNYFVTTDGHGSYAIICHNQKTLNYRYYLSKEDEIQKDQLWKYFDDQEALQLSLRLEGLPEGRYQIKSYQINEEMGSLLHLWGQMGYEPELSRHDTQYLKQICAAKLTITTQDTQNAALPLELTLQCNEIRFLRLTPLHDLPAFSLS